MTAFGHQAEEALTIEQLRRSYRLLTGEDQELRKWGITKQGKVTEIKGGE